MKRLMISALAAVTLLAATTATAMLWSPLTNQSAGTAAMPSLRELHAAAGAIKLSNQEIEDRSLIFPNIAKPLVTTSEAKR
jgi:hypothetical protein